MRIIVKKSQRSGWADGPNSLIVQDNDLHAAVWRPDKTRVAHGETSVAKAGKAARLRPEWEHCRVAAISINENLQGLIDRRSIKDEKRMIDLENDADIQVDNHRLSACRTYKEPLDSFFGNESADRHGDSAPVGVAQVEPSFS